MATPRPAAVMTAAIENAIRVICFSLPMSSRQNVAVAAKRVSLGTDPPSAHGSVASSCATGAAWTSWNRDMTVDAIIIGAGQAGPPLANRLTGAGMKVAFVERGNFGGTCVNTGCTPTKTMVASAYAAHLARRARDYGVVVEGPVTVDMAAVKARADAVVARSRGNIEKWLRGMPGCTVLRGHAAFESPTQVRVGNEVLSAPRIFVNVGGRAAVPPIPGITMSRTSTTARSSRWTACLSTW